MDCKLITCSRKKRSYNANGDRLTSLPDELLCRILCMLPTKDAAATLISSKRMRKAFSWITSVDLDDSPISHCTERPYLVERFHVFESFVDNLLPKLSPPTLTRFRLHFGGNINRHRLLNRVDDFCQQACFADVVPARLNAWISYPLAHGGLTELDLSFHVRRPHQCKLPPTLFACQSLEVLRLSSNLAIDDAKIPVICLPNLKLLHFCSFVFNDDDFVSRLILSCPILEDLAIKCCLWMNGDRVSIFSPSLRRLELTVTKKEEFKGSDLLLLDTPNLQYLHYVDMLAARYSIAHMNALVKASIDILDVNLDFETQLRLIRALSHIPELSLLRCCVTDFYYAEELKDQLPVFPNLTTLGLGNFDVEGRWDTMLPLILHFTPSLETLVFEEGLFYNGGYSLEVGKAALEAEGWTSHVIPSCCLTHLKRIIFKECFGIDRELSTIKFLLSKSSVLEELVLCLSSAPCRLQFDPPNLHQFENTVKELPRASNSCLITLKRCALNVTPSVPVICLPLVLAQRPKKEVMVNH